MPKTLVIVESPTKAKTISKFLGSSYIVESSFGHIRDLPKKNMGIDIEGGTFEPTYEIPTDKKERVTKLKKLAKQCGEIIFATDEDREGEAISWHLAYILGVDPRTSKRIVFHEITKSAISDALANPRTIDQKLVDAQQARRVLDRLVGYELSPFLWKKVARGLSAGRVQSVAVRLIVEREREIMAFIPTEYWSIEALFETAKNEELKATLYGLNGKKYKKFELGNKEITEKILTALKNQKYHISFIENKQTKRNPPPPFRTSTLQQTANQKLGYSSKQTMRLAQQLYEGIDLGSGGQTGLITYMRTDSTNLSSKFLAETSDFVKNNYGEKYSLSKARVYAGKTKGAQEAHEAIRPTDPTRTPESIKGYLEPSQYKLYSLIWKRAVATQMAQAIINKTTLSIDTSHEGNIYTFRANGQSIHFDGWLSLYPESVKEEMLPALNEKENLECKELKPEQHFTQPPARYSDATLIKALEEHGIGRPSTYSPTISTIEARKYVERDENKRFKPLDISMIVTDLFMEHFSDIVDYSFTAKMEENLDDIAEGKKDWQPIISTFYHPFHENIEKKTENITRDDVSQTRELGIDQKSGKPISVRIGRYGPYVQKGDKDDEEKPLFASLPKGMNMDEVTMEIAQKLFTLPRSLGEYEGEGEIKANIGRFGPYVQIGKEYYSLKKYEKDPYSITYEEAVEIIKEGKEEKAKRIIKVFEKEGIEIKRGPYGIYITDGKKNAKIPKEIEDPSTLSLEECQEIIKNAKPGKRRFTKKKKS